MAKRLVDVEDLVIWTADELSRKRPSNVTTLPVFDLGRENRDLVGKWDRPMGYPTMSPMFSAGLARAGGARGDPPHADALIVEAAIERLKLTKPDCPIGDADLAAGVGFEIDLEGAKAAAFANVANLLLVHGRLRSRPLLCLAPLEPSPRLAANGKPGVWMRQEWAEATFGDHAEARRCVEVAAPPLRKGVYPSGAYGGLEWSPDPQIVINERAEYAAWLAGLAWLAGEVSGELATRAALPPRSALCPWLGDQDGAPTRDLFGAGAEGVFSRDEAEGLQAERRGARRRPSAGGAVYRGRPTKPARGMREA